MFYNHVFETKLWDYVKGLGVDLYGVADLGTARDFILNQGGKSLEHFPRAVTLGYKLSNTILNSLSYLSDKNAFIIYNHYIHQTVDKILDHWSALTAKFIESDGYLAYPVPAYQISGNYQGIISHKIAPHLAGLGWIGKNNLLVTPEHGPRVRFSTILTDAPLKEGSPAVEQCGKCNLCVKSCPPGALQGLPFNFEEERDIRINVQACIRYSLERAKTWGIPPTGSLCGLCIAICPFGRKMPGARLQRKKPQPGDLDSAPDTI